MGCKFSFFHVMLIGIGVVADLRCEGRHVDLKGNLIKAMMVMNWLNMLEVEKF